MKEIKMNNDLKELDSKHLDEVSGGEAIEIVKCPECGKDRKVYYNSNKDHGYSEEYCYQLCGSCFKKWRNLVHEGKAVFDMITGKYVLEDEFKSSLGSDKKEK